MKILFAGTPEIAVPSLEAIATKWEICSVLTNPDRKSGRGKKMTSPPVKIKAEELGLSVMQPEKLSDVVEAIKELKPDLMVVVAFGKIFRQDFLDLFPRGAINLHPSALPKYRGPCPINAAIENGDKTTAISIQKVALKMDSGDIILQKEMALDGTETAGSLTEKSAQIGAKVLCEAIEMMESGKSEPKVQNEDDASYCFLLNKKDGVLDWCKSAVELERKIRAFFPWPGTSTIFDGKSLAILEADLYTESVEKSDAKPGTVLGRNKKKGLLIQTGDGVLAVKRVQPQSRKAMDFNSFLNGTKDLIGSKWGEENG